MPKSRQRKNHKQKSLARTKRVKAEQAKFQKEYQAKMMEQINKLKEGIFDFIAGIITCMMCCSTWVGFFLGAVVYSPSHELFSVTPYISWFFDGLIASGFVWAFNGMVEWFEENRPVK